MPKDVLLQVAPRMVQKPAAMEIQAVVGKFVGSMSSKCMPMPYRVPTVSKYARRGGDVQSVFVVPELRDRRVGALLMGAVLDEARRLELEHVTVHSSPRAVAFYERNGWDHDPEWLSWAAESHRH